MSSSIRPNMTVLDYFGFASMCLLLIGAVNWGVVAIRYASGDLIKASAVSGITESSSAYDLYKAAPTPDLLELFSASPDVQMFVYWAVFVSGIFYLGLFIWNSIELRTVDA